MIATATSSSSQELTKAASKRLKGNCYPGIRRLSCECDDQGVLHLQGRLPSFYQKQLAQEAVASFPGVVEVVNQVEVVSRQSTKAELA